jgi:PPOX class probable F420-dependent enzyme
MADDTTAPLGDERYINLETFKRDGTGVKTPVWAAPLDGRLVLMSAGDSYKVKRLRRDPHVRAAGCDVRGRVRGDWHEGTGRVLESREDVERAHAALRQKYGWQMAATDLLARLAGRMSKRAYMELTLG